MTIYTVTENLGGWPPLTYELSLPATFIRVHLPTARVTRHGGAATSDEPFRRERYQRVGAVTVAGRDVATAK